MHAVFRDIFDALDREDHILPGFRAQQARIPARVCRQWETFAAACPWLWTFLEFSARRQWESGWKKQMLYLERSEGLPLDICIRGTLAFGDNATAIMTSIADILIPQAHRWKSLRAGPYGIHNIPCPMEALQVLLQRMQGLGFPSLEYLMMHADVTYEELAGLPIWLGPGATPNLRYVMLTDIPTSYRASMFDNLWLLSVDDQRLANYPVSALAEFLVNFIVRSPDLASLTFVAPPKDFVGQEGHLVQMPTPSAIPRMLAQDFHIVSELHSLGVQSDSGDLVSLLLRVVQLPLLEELTEVNSDIPALTITILPTLATANPLERLKILHLQGLSINPGSGSNPEINSSVFVDHLAAALSAMRELVILFLDDVKLGDNHIMALQEVCPKLAALCLADCKFPTIQVWDAMMKERISNGITTLKKLEFTPLPWLEEEIDAKESSALQSLNGRVENLVYTWEGDEEEDWDDIDDDDDDEGDDEW